MPLGILSAISNAQIEETIKQLKNTLAHLEEIIERKVDAAIQEKMGDSELSDAQRKKKEELVEKLTKQFKEEVNARIEQMERIRDTDSI